VEKVLQGNPQLLLARVNLDTREAALANARHGLLPSLAATGSYAMRGYETDLSGSFAELGRGDLPEWSVGATLALPLYNRADRGKLAQVEAEFTAAELDLHALEASLAQEARAQVRTLEAAARDVELATLNVQLAEETLGAERARLEEGRALQKDVITAVKDLDAARVELERAKAAWQDALVALRRLQGAL
jgi:outer membrane protein TolC